MSRIDRCPSCNGQVKSVTGAGRFAEYRGVRCEVPHNLAIDTCAACGSEWMGEAETDLLSESFERQRLVAMAWIQ